MERERWLRVREIFEGALARQAAERKAYVAAEAGSDQGLRDEVLRMLDHASDSGSSLAGPAVPLSGLLVAAGLAESLAPGTVLSGRYRIVRAIGAGGMGEVYEAQDLDLGATIALKTLTGASLASRNGLERFKREVRMARTVTHPNVCRLFDLERHHETGTGKPLVFLTMELIAGETLSAYLERRGPLPVEEALPIVRQLCAGLDAAHACEVIHRDLKPANIMVSGDGAGLRLVITDFGLARPLAEITEESVTVAGTPAYMAPEQYEDQPATPATDNYALGVLLYEMVTGRRPFAAASAVALALQKVRHAPPSPVEFAPSLPAAWETAILRCLDPDPRRYQRAGEVLAALERGARGRRRLALNRRQRRWAVWAAAGAVTLLVAALVVARLSYTPSAGARALYRQGVAAFHHGLPLRATKLLEDASLSDRWFPAAHARLALAWLELDQPDRAHREMEKARLARPRWMRWPLDDQEVVAAAEAEIRDDLPSAAAAWQRASRLGDADARYLALVELARIQNLQGDAAGAAAILRPLATGPGCPTEAMARYAPLAWAKGPVALLMLDAARACLESAGNLEGETALAFLDASLWETANDLSGSYRRLESAMTRALQIGSVEEQIRIASAISLNLEWFQDPDDAYAQRVAALDLAAKHQLPFLAARVFADHAQWHFSRRNFVLASTFAGLAQSSAKGCGAFETQARMYLLSARIFSRMGFPDRARQLAAEARVQLRNHPSRTVSAEIAEFERRIESVPPRPEDAVVSGRTEQPAQAARPPIGSAAAAGGVLLNAPKQAFLKQEKKLKRRREMKRAATKP